MGNFLKNTAFALGVPAAIIGGAFIIKGEIPVCVTDPGWDNCMPDVPEWLSDFLSRGDELIPDEESETFSSRVEGGVTAIRITPDKWPLFDRVVELEPLQIIQDGDVEYQSRETYLVSTSMEGSLLAIVDDRGEEEMVYVVGIDDKGTPDGSDDTVRPIDFRDYTVFSETGVDKRVFSPGMEAEYEACVTELNAGNRDYPACAITEIAENQEAHLPEILENVRTQYVGFDACTVRTLHIMSNLMRGGRIVANGGDGIYPETLTVSEVAGKSIQERTAGFLGKDESKVQVILAHDPATNKPVEWQPGDRIDLSQVEQLSDGKYDAPDVRVDGFCFGGSWDLNATQASEIKYLTDNGVVGPDLLDPKWYEDHTFINSPMPAHIAATTFNPDQTIKEVPAAAPPAATTTVG